MSKMFKEPEVEVANKYIEKKKKILWIKNIYFKKH